MYNKWEDKIEQSDLYIRPELDEFTTFSFDQSEEIMRRGDVAMEKVEDQLKALAARQRGGRPERSIASYTFNQEFMIKEVLIKGNRNYTDQYCIKKLGLKKNEIISREDFMRGIDVLTATG
jgi:NTE family protein